MGKVGGRGGRPLAGQPKNAKRLLPREIENEGVCHPQVRSADRRFGWPHPSLGGEADAGPGPPAESDFLTSTAGAMSGLRASTSFPPSQSCDQWLSSPTRESVTRYRGATVPDSHGVPAPPTVFETVPASREAGASRNWRDMGVSAAGFQTLISKISGRAKSDANSFRTVPDPTEGGMPMPGGVPPPIASAE